ncbi:MAG: DUF4956 domain-containing protein [Clostridia bacterium]|nr:DUF4956 domain-containing protein [Clostridia bacterium]
MDIFNSIYSSSSVTAGEFFLMAGIALVAGFLYSYILSFRMRTSQRMFIVTALLPVIIATILTFINGNIGAGVAIGGAFALIRFRSAQGTADELVSIFITMAAGVAFGMGYVAYGILTLIGLGGVYVLLSFLHIYSHKSFSEEKLLKVTIPETLEYTEVFKNTFDHYLKEVQSVGVKTVGMGSMFRLSFRIRLKNSDEEKEFIDELRVKNGNLEISIVPYAENNKDL